MLKKSKQNRVIDKYLRQISGCFVGNFYWKDKEGRYLGSNESTLYMSGKRIEVVGKTDYDIWPERAEQLRKNDLAVMRSEKALSFEETIQVGKDVKYYAVLKVPMKDDDGNIIGIIGNSVDITARKELESLRRATEEQHRITELVNNLVHDIRTPLLILGNFSKICKNLTEKEHVILRDCVFSIQNIIHSLLDKYKHQDSRETGSVQSILVSQALEELVFRRKFQKKSSGKRLSISLQYDSSAEFAFICGNVSNFERMMDNLINNALEALNGKAGLVEILFNCNDSNVKIVVKDNGSGMPREMAERLMNNLPVSSTKKNGHGIGTRQIQSALQELEGNMQIESREGMGTKVTLRIPRAREPAWAIREIEIHPKTVIVVLDDDVSMHNVWKGHFEKRGISLENVVFFSESQGALDFINKYKENNELLLLCDYEIRNQELSGLDVIVQSGLYNKAILVSSAYAHVDVQNKAMAHGIKILPKPFVEKFQIKIKEEKKQDRLINRVVLVDDDPLLTDTLSGYLISRNLMVDIFHNPKDLLDNIHNYEENVQIVMDNDFKGAVTIPGYEFAHQLYNLGYKKLYVFSGIVDRSSLSRFPNCIEFISKADENSFENLLKILSIGKEKNAN